MARRVAEELKRQPYLNTQENVWSILALGKIARASNKTTGTAAVLANGKTIGTTSGNSVRIDMKAYASQPIQLQVKDAGLWYYFWETSGIAADGSYKQEDSYLKVRRTY